MKRYWIGIILIIVGVLFLLNSFGIIACHELVHEYWPVLLILLGAIILIKDRKSKS